MKKIKYIAKPDEWFDVGTEVQLIDDYRASSAMYFGGPEMNAGLFEGLKDGKIDQEVCSFDEFDIIEEGDF